MDNEIRKQNKIPGGGYEQYTRPEEILGLQKYLRSVKEAYDSELYLEKNNLEIAKRASFKDMKDLPDGLQVLDTRDNTSELVSNKEWLEADRKIEVLDTIRQRLDETKEPRDLETRTVGLSVGGATKSLSERLIRIGDTQGPELEPTVEKLGMIEDPVLQDYKDTLGPGVTVETLGGSKENLDVLQDLELGNLKKNLDVPGEQDLMSKVTKLTGVSGSTELGSSRVSLSELTEVELESAGVEKIEGTLDPVLQDYKDTLGPGVTVETLGGSKENLDVHEEQELETTLEGINDLKDDIDLSSTRVGNQVNREVKLEYLRKDLGVTSYNISDLPGDRANLNLDVESELEVQKVELKEVNKGSSLSTNREILGIVSNDIGLLETKDLIPGSHSEVVLGGNVSTLQRSQEPSTLSDSRVNLGKVNQVEDLQVGRKSLEVQEGPGLVDTRVGMDGEPEEDHLSVTLVNRGGDSRNPDLESFIDTLTDDTITSIDSKSVSVPGGQSEVKLENYASPGISDQKDVSLTEVLLNLEVENEETMLSGSKDILKVTTLGSDIKGVKIPISVNEVDTLEGTKKSRPGIDFEFNVPGEVLRLDSPETVPLEETLLKMSTPKEVSIEENKVELERENPEIELENVPIGLLDCTSDIELSSVKSELEVDPKVSMPTKPIQISPDQVTSLKSRRKDLVVVNTGRPLDTKKEKLGPSETSLEDIGVGETKLYRPEDKTILNKVRRGDRFVMEGNKEWDETQGLEDFLSGMLGNDPTEDLGTTSRILPENGEPFYPEDYNYRSIIGRPDNKECIGDEEHNPFSPEEDELYDSIVGRPDDNMNFHVIRGGKIIVENKEWDDGDGLEKTRIKNPGQGLNNGKTRKPPRPGLPKSTVGRPDDDLTKENSRYTRGDDGKWKLVKDLENHDSEVTSLTELTPDSIKTPLESQPGNESLYNELDEKLGNLLSHDNSKEDERPKDEFIESFDTIMRNRSIWTEEGKLHKYRDSILALAKKLDGTPLEGVASKIRTLVSTYLSHDYISRDNAEKFESELCKILMTRDLRNIPGSQTNWKYNGGLTNAEGLLSQPRNSKKGLDNSEDKKDWDPSKFDFEDPKWNGGKGLGIPRYNGGRDPKTVFYKNTSMGEVLDSLDYTRYLRYIAETTVGLLPTRTGDKYTRRLRALLLDEALALLVLGRTELEKLGKANKDRLPGDDLGVLSDLMSGGPKKALNSAIDSAIGLVCGVPDMRDPKNRPSTESKETEFKPLSKKGFANYKENNSKKVTFTEYLDKTTGTGFTTTLEDLVGVGKSEIKSVDSLMTALKMSPYYTTSNNVGSSKVDMSLVRTLDTNMYWEVVFEPFKGKDNGGVTFLPDLNFINEYNQEVHGAVTAYNKWIPVNSFELGKSKLTSKTLELFNGEISYPTSLEFTNEFRMTFVDDQYKSWRVYFENCVDTMIYYSKPYTDYKSFVVNKKYTCLSPYKNVTFRCRIYCMTPQLSTITKYDLLLVLKDFTEERSGEIDGAASDLNVSFSIVGENPSEATSKFTISNDEKTAFDNKKKDAANLIADRNKKDYGEILSSGAKSGVNIIM